MRACSRNGSLLYCNEPTLTKAIEAIEGTESGELKLTDLKPQKEYFARKRISLNPTPCPLMLL